MYPKNNPLKLIIFIGYMVCFLYPTSLLAESETQQEQSPALFDSIWNASTLYNDKNNPYVQSFSLVGRYHGQYWVADAGENKDEDWENRRMYLGFNGKLFQQFTLEVQVSLNDDFNPAYKGLYDAFIKWETLEKDFSISGGRLDYVYTGLERSTSSKKIKTMERALLVNLVMPGEVIGLYAKGKKGDLSYQAGIFSGSIKDEFTDFEGGFGTLLGLSYKAPLFYDKGTLHLDYLYNDGDPDNNAFKDYEHILSIWHQGKIGPLEIDTDFTTASGIEDQSDIFGFTVLPSYDFAQNLLIPGDKLQLALRYHYASSSDDFGLKFNKRYEQKVVSGEGGSYNSYYIGLNYYIYQQKLKIMTGFEYFDMSDVVMDETTNTEDVTGWNFISGVRLYF